MANNVSTFTVTGALDYEILVPPSEKKVVAEVEKRGPIRFRSTWVPGTETYTCEYVTDSAVIANFLRKLIAAGKVGSPISERITNAVIDNPYDDFTAPNTEAGQKAMAVHLTEILDDEGNPIPEKLYRAKGD